MSVISIIEKKKRKESLTKEEIEYVINGFLDRTILESQMSAFLMAVYFNGMNDDEVYYLTDVMIKSGDVIELDRIDGITVDKHSTGGVGDKISLILLPIVSSCGIKVPKMSGRSLGHTGGTIDKLESIPGFRTSMSIDYFIEQVNEIGMGIISQTMNMVPADKKIYALRSNTATTDSIPLIASSIMSKKIASGAKKIVIDVKVGEGALVKTLENAKELSRTMIEIGKRFDRKVVCLLTNMNYPLGKNIGNTLEVIEAVEVLNGKGTGDLKSLSLELAAIMISIGKDISREEAYLEAKETLESGKAFEKFKEFVSFQGGSLGLIELSQDIVQYNSKLSGYITDIDARRLADFIVDIRSNEKVDAKTGIILNHQVGDYVEVGEKLLDIYLNRNDDMLDEDINYDEILDKCFTISKEKPKEVKLIYEVIE